MAEQHHVLPVKLYLLIFLALITGTALTVAVAYIDLSFLNTPIALIIAFVKASLVILFFMHAKYSHKLVGLFSVVGFFWLAILLVLTLQDYYTRDWMGPAPVQFLEAGVPF